MCGTPAPRSWQTEPIAPALLLLLTACLGSDSGTAADSAVDWHERSDDSDTAPVTDSEGPGAPVEVWVVRHAEKGDGSDPSLTEEGAERAQALAQVMADVPIRAVYTSDLVRSQETCQPTADAHGLPLVTDINPEAELAEHVLSEHLHDTVLTCGHSYTVPDLLDALGVEDAESLSGYGQIWIVTAYTGGTATVEMGHFGDE